MSKHMLLLNFGLVLLMFVFLFGAIRSLGKQSQGRQVSGSTVLGLAKTKAQQTRQHPRVDIEWPVTMQVDQGEPISGETKNLSLGGAFIQCETPLPLQQTFGMIIQAPDREPISARAQVIWSNANVPADKVVCRGMGIRFLDLSEEDRRFLHSKCVAQTSEGEQAASVAARG